MYIYLYICIYTRKHEMCVRESVTVIFAIPTS